MRRDARVCHALLESTDDSADGTGTTCGVMNIQEFMSLQTKCFVTTEVTASEPTMFLRVYVSTVSYFARPTCS